MSSYRIVDVVPTSVFGFLFALQKSFWKTILKQLFKEKVLDVVTDETSYNTFTKVKFDDNLKSKVNSDPQQFRKAWKSFSKKNFRQSGALKAVLRRPKLTGHTIKRLTSATAKIIFRNMGLEIDEDWLTLDDLRFIFVEDDAARAMKVLSGELIKTEIDFDELKSSIRSIYEQRQSLFNTLNDRDNMSKTLATCTNVGLGVVMFFVIFFIWDVNFQTVVLPFSSFILGFAFVFGTSLQRMWLSFVWIFVTRPYDIGDRIKVEGVDVHHLIVNKIDLLTTEFFNPDGRMFLYPNWFLAEKPIEQYKRSRDYAVFFYLIFGRSTSPKQLEDYQEKVQEWITSDFSNWDSPLFWIEDYSYSNRLQIGHWCTILGINWSTPKDYLLPRSRFILACKTIAEQLNIEYVEVKQPVDVHMQARPEKAQAEGRTLGLKPDPSVNDLNSEIQHEFGDDGGDSPSGFTSDVMDPFGPRRVSRFSRQQGTGRKRYMRHPPGVGYRRDYGVPWYGYGPPPSQSNAGESSYIRPSDSASVANRPGNELHRIGSMNGGRPRPVRRHSRQRRTSIHTDESGPRILNPFVEPSDELGSSSPQKVLSPRLSERVTTRFNIDRMDRIRSMQSADDSVKVPSGPQQSRKNTVASSGESDDELDIETGSGGDADVAEGNANEVDRLIQGQGLQGNIRDSAASDQLGGKGGVNWADDEGKEVSEVMGKPLYQPDVTGLRQRPTALRNNRAERTNGTDHEDSEGVRPGCGTTTEPPRATSGSDRGTLPPSQSNEEVGGTLTSSR